MKVMVFLEVCDSMLKTYFNSFLSGVYQYRYHFTKSTLKRCQTWSIHSWWRWVPYWQRISDFIGLCDWKGTNSPSVSFEKSLSTMGWIEAQNIFQVCVLVPQWSNGQLWHWTWHNCVYIQWWEWWGGGIRQNQISVHYCRGHAHRFGQLYL